MADKQVIVEIKYNTTEAIKSVNNLTSAIEGERVEQARLKKQLDDGKISQTEYSKAVEQSKQRLSESNRERAATIKLLGSEKGSIDELRAHVKVLTQERNKLNLSTAEGRTRLKEINSQLDSHNKIIRGNVDGYTRLKLGIGDYVNKLGAIPGPIGSVISGIGGMTKAALTFIATPLGLVLTAIAGAVALLVSAFKTFEPLLDKIEQGMAALSAVFNVFKDTVLAVVTGQKSLSEAISGVGSASKKAAEEAVKLKKAEQDLEDLTVRSIVTQAKAKRQIDELLLQSKDRTKTEQDRIKLIDQALKIEEAAYNERKKIADGNVQQALGQIMAGRQLTEEQKKQLKIQGVAYAQKLQETKNISKKEVEALAAALAAQENILDESVMIREKAINRQNALEDKQEQERIKRIEKQKADAEKAKAEAEKAAEKAKNDAEKAAKAKEDALKHEQEILKFSREIDEITEEEYYKKLAEFRDKNFAKDTESYRQITIEIKKAADNKLKIQEEADKKIAERRGAAIDKMADIEAKSLIDSAKGFEKRKEALTKQADEEYQIAITKKGALDEEIQLAEVEHKAKLAEIDKEYQDKVREQHKQTLATQLDAMQQIIAATYGLVDERVTILSDGLARISTINFKEVKSATDAFVAIGTAAQGLTSLITAGNQKQLSDLERQKQAELAMAGDNADAKAKIEKDYNTKLVELKKKQFKEDKIKATVDASIATALAIAKAIAASPLTGGLPFSAINAALGAVQIAAIQAQPEPSFSSDQVFAKGGIIGGKPHSMGGTKFVGSDGSMFEAEQGESMFVLKKDATAEIAALSAINEAFGGRSFSSGKSQHLQQGGEAGQDVNNFERSVNDAIQRTPIIVKVSDIELGLTNYNNVKQAGTI